MKVRIQQRSVYHKYAEVEVEIPNNIKEDEISEYLLNIEESWEVSIDEKLQYSEYQFGSGVDDYDGMNDDRAESEWRYQCDELKTGGHL
jgi:hypothetical protein|tara:strand:+ start:1956 stop:2222 length:267 start_codon:yes stop_codon:yes gene_type:complete